MVLIDMTQVFCDHALVNHDTTGVTLLELLRFHAEAYVALVRRLFDLEVCINIESDHGVKPLTDSSLDHALAVLKNAKSECGTLDLAVCSLHIDDLYRAACARNLKHQDVSALMDNIGRELSSRYFVSIQPERKRHYADSLNGWEDIVAVFRDASDDVIEMNKCYALCRYPAAVFHSLLVVEHGLVRLGKAMGVTDPKEGWDASTRKLATVVEAGYKANNTGIDFALLEQINSASHAMKHAWRNKVNHATGKPLVMAGIASYVAEEIMTATRAFMRRLADGFSTAA